MRIRSWVTSLFIIFLPVLANGQHTLLLRDEGMSRLSFLDQQDAVRWQVDVPPGRDLQLVGKSRVLLGTANGYEERSVVTGEKIEEVTAWPGTIAARRLVNG